MNGTAARYARTLAHLKPWQVAGRVVAAGKRSLRLFRFPEVSVGLRGQFAPKVRPPRHDPWNNGNQLRAGRFTFLNEVASLGRPPDWEAAGMPLLWRFNLHYFHYLHLLPSEEQEALCRSWIQSNHPGSVGWHPYPTSLRIVNWCRANLQGPDLQQSLYRQAGFLFRNLETYVYGNHLLENARALVHAGCFFAGQGEADRWLEKGLKIYREQTPEQVLPDGGHFERSPMYHALMLEGYVDVLNLLPEGHSDADWLRDTVRRMVGFLRATTHPDGQLALFNDSTQEIALAPADLEAYAVAVAGEGALAESAYPDTGYYVYRDEDLYLIVDAGPAGPDYLMAHAHADIFSYELSIGGKQFITDTGVFGYVAGPMRDYVRSTRAHNTVTIDGQDQIECWGSFRVGHRVEPSAVRCKAHAGSFAVSGAVTTKALRGERTTIHRRLIAVDPDHRTVKVDDEIRGTGGRLIESRVHLHPQVTMEISEKVIMRRDDHDCAMTVSGARVRKELNWYCPQFGVRELRPTLVLSSETTLPTTLACSYNY